MYRIRNQFSIDLDGPQLALNDPRQVYEGKTLFFTGFQGGSPGPCGGRAPRARGRRNTIQ